jgi:hypothetical protein
VRLIGNCRGASRAFVVVDRDVGATLGESDRNCPADASASASDERDTAGKRSANISRVVPTF